MPSLAKPRQSFRWWRWAAAVLASLALNALVLGKGGGLLVSDDDPPPPLEVVAVYADPPPSPPPPEPPPPVEDELVALGPPRADAPPVVPQDLAALLELPEPVPPEPPDEEPPPPPPPPPPENLPSVNTSVTDAVRPDNPEFLAESDNRVEEQTQAVETTRDEPVAASQQPTDEPEESEPTPVQEVPAEAETPPLEQLARAVRPESEPPPEPAPLPIPPTPPVETPPTPSPPDVPPARTPPAPNIPTSEAVPPGDAPLPPAPSTPAPPPRLRPVLQQAFADLAPAEGEPGIIGQIGAVHAESYVAVFGERTARDRATEARARREASIVGDARGRWERTRSALENFDVNVRAGTETHLNTAASAFAPFIHEVHLRIHPRWSSYLTFLDFGGGPSLSALDNPTLRVVLEFVVTSSGIVDDVRIVQTSGVLAFDGEAIDMLYALSPLPVPPPAARSADGNTYVHWAFHRDARQCGTFSVSIRFVRAPAGANPQE